MAKVAIALPVYNDEIYVTNAIESILNQTCKDFTLHILVDGATDNSYKECLKYNPFPLVQIAHISRNIGLSAALNAIIQIIGESDPDVKYIARQDADDYSYPLRLECQVNYLDQNPNCGMLGTSYEVINQGGIIIDRTKAKTIDLKEALFFNNQFCHGSMVFRSEVFDKVGLYDENFKRCQDYELYLRIAEKYDIANLTTFLYQWRNSEKFHRLLPERKRFVMMARYKAYCRNVGIEFKPENFKENMF